MFRGNRSVAGSSITSYTKICKRYATVFFYYAREAITAKIK